MMRMINLFVRQKTRILFYTTDQAQLVLSHLNHFHYFHAVIDVNLFNYLFVQSVLFNRTYHQLNPSHTRTQGNGSVPHPQLRNAHENNINKIADTIVSVSNKYNKTGNGNIIISISPRQTLKQTEFVPWNIERRELDGGTVILLGPRGRVRSFSM